MLDAAHPQAGSQPIGQREETHVLRGVQPVRSRQRGLPRGRIPTLLTTAKGTILAFNEARKFTGRDTDQINLFLRRSFDGGRSFEKVQVVATLEGWVTGNPASV